MKISAKNWYAAAVTLLAVFSFLCGFYVWFDFQVPFDQWHSGVVAEPVAAPKAQATLLQLQWLPWRSDFLVDKNRPVRGVAIGYFLQQNDIDGVSLALMHSGNARKRGVSLSLVDLTGESHGLAMFIAGGAVNNKGCSVGLWNMAECNQGVQLGIVNHAQENLLMDYDMKPKKESDEFGVQAGVVNYSEGKGIQFGLWNTNPNSFIKHFPLINICF